MTNMTALVHSTKVFFKIIIITATVQAVLKDSGPCIMFQRSCIDKLTQNSAENYPDQVAPLACTTNMDLGLTDQLISKSLYVQ